MTNVGDLGHTELGHNEWERRVTAQAARFGVTPPAFTGPHALGAPEHIAVHNTYAAALEPILTAAGISATLPDAANVGDLGHVADHDLLFAAVAALEALTTPAAPTLVTADPIPAGVSLTWSPPADDGGYPILGYRLEWRATGATDWTRVTPDTAADASTGVAMTSAVGTYEVRVKAVNRLGAGHPSNVLSAEVTIAWNEATGGTVTEATRPSGEVWRTHRFGAGAGSFSVQLGTQPFTVILSGGARGGASSACCGSCASPMESGGTWTSDTVTLAPGDYPLTIGSGGGGGGWPYPCTGGNCSPNAGAPGGASSFNGQTAPGGGAGGNGPAVTSDIEGTSRQYLAASHGGGCGDGVNGGRGDDGFLYVSYRIG